MICRSQAIKKRERVFCVEYIPLNIPKEKREASRLLSFLFDFDNAPPFLYTRVCET